MRKYDILLIETEKEMDTVMNFFYFLVKMTVLVFAMKYFADIAKTFINAKYKKKEDKKNDVVGLKQTTDERFTFRK